MHIKTQPRTSLTILFNGMLLDLYLQITAMPLSTPQIKQELEQLDQLMLNAEEEHNDLLQKVHPSQYNSAVNLLHYLALRSTDIRNLQDALHEQGFSSLASSESHIRSQVLAVLNHFGHSSQPPAVTYGNSKMLLQRRTNILFGTASFPSIMVTLKTSHAHDYLAVKKLLKAGMNIARINCAHDDEETWSEMIKNVRQASQSTGIACKIYMDLAGPKIRTVIKGKKNRILLEEEDKLYFTDSNNRKKNGVPVVSSNIPHIATQLKEGEKVLFDDGLIEAKVDGVKKDGVTLEVTRVSSKKSYLKNEKGINFPDSQLSLSALTGFDRKCLPFILEHADMTGYSFVQNENDIAGLQNEMKEKKLPMILKIETPEAFKNLPGLLFKAMEEECFGVMLARGDLAVEMGFERMSEVQEEICWICEAAHTPLIWATQVLENMNKKGIATRSEVTDAAHSIVAECILINKGPHTVKVIKTLKDILQRSRGHHLKKRFLLRPLHIAKEFLAMNEQPL
ncbi:MAG: pyruvate kinase [Flavisolibacter sp.]